MPESHGTRDSQPRFLIVGATSGIAMAVCRRLAARGCALVLAAHDAEELQRLAADLRTRRNDGIATVAFNALDLASSQSLVARALDAGGGPCDGVLVCHGVTPRDPPPLGATALEEMVRINFVSTVLILEAAASHLEQRRHGILAALSSVAGDRGRQSNYPYGATKAALTAYLSGLRNRLYHRGVRVVTVKPGFVATRMTEGMTPPSPWLVASPDRVARDIERALFRGHDVVYTPWFWRWIMRIICAIPERLFKRLTL